MLLCPDMVDGTPPPVTHWLDCGSNGGGSNAATGALLEVCVYSSVWVMPGPAAEAAALCSSAHAATGPVVTAQCQPLVQAPLAQ